MKRLGHIQQVSILGQQKVAGFWSQVGSKKCFIFCEIRDTCIRGYWNQTKFPTHTQSTMAKRGLTNRANVHTPMWKSWQNSNRSNNFGCNWTSFHNYSNKIIKLKKADGRGSGATRVETSNRIPFLTLVKSFKQSSFILSQQTFISKYM